MDKNSFKKIKDNLPGMDELTHRYLSESFAVIAIAVASFSAWRAIFMGGPFLSFIFIVIGSVIGIFCSDQADKMLKMACETFYKKNRTSEIIGGSVMIAVALFVPFIYFGFLGVLIGGAYHYYLKNV